jgi:plastocyanin
MTALPSTLRRVGLPAVTAAAALAVGAALVIAAALTGTVAAADTTVKIGDSTFTPAKVTISAGQLVTWLNTSTTTHTVTADDGSFDSGELAQNDQFANVFDTPGTYTYHCAIHPKMTGTVIVKAAAATPSPSGPPPPTPPPGTLPPSFRPYATPTPVATPVPTPTLGPAPTPAPSAGPDAGTSTAGSIPVAALLVVVAAVAAGAVLILLRRYRAT